MLLRSLLVLLACFCVAGAVTPAQAQQVRLGWDAPLQADGTLVPDLAGYRLFYGSQSGQYQTMVPVGLTTTYTVTNLSAGQTYYFSIKAYNTTGIESAFSNEVSTTLPPLQAPPPSSSQPGGSLIPQQQIRVVSVDSQDTAGGNYAAANALDGNAATMWHSEWFLRTPSLPHTLVLDLGSRYLVDGFQYVPRQDGSPNGTIANYAFYVSDDGITWGNAAATGTLAANTSEKIVRFTAQAGRFVCLVALSEIQGNPSYTSAAELNIFGTAAPAPTPTISLVIPSDTTSSWSSSALASTMTTSQLTTQQTPATTSPETSASQSSAQTASPQPGGSLIPQQQIRVVSVDSQDTAGGNYAAANALDGNAATMWHSEWFLRTPSLPHTLVLDLGSRYLVDGFQYVPRQDGSPNGTIANYAFYVSDDGITWGNAAATGTLAANTSEKIVRFTAQAGRFVCLVALSEIQGNPSYTSAAELNIFGTAAPAPTPTTTVSQHTRWEMTLTSTTTYANPFTDVTVRVQYTKAGSPPLTGYGFWDGGSTFKLRQTFPEAGTWYYKTTATDASNSGLHNREGNVQVVPYTGTNVLYRHGFLQVSADQRFLAHADGTPFLWVADTLWGATVWLTEAGFHEAVADRRAKHFTVLQTNLARKNEVDTAGETPWQGDRWNVRFMQKLDRMFNDANDQGMYLFVNGLVDLLWDRRITQYERLVEMIGARYAGHYVSLGSSMDDSYDPVHEQIHAAIRRTAPHILLAQHPSNVWTAEQYYDTPLVDYIMDQTGAAGNLEQACHNVIEWSSRLYNHGPPKPVVNAEAWYEGYAGGTAEMTMQLGYLSLLSGNVGYTYGTSLWNAKDVDLPAWKAFRGATYMQYLHDFFAALDGGRPLRPRHALIKNQATLYEERMVLGVSTDGLTYAAFLPQGGTIHVDLTALARTVGVTWYNPLTGQYRDQGIALGGAVRSFVSPFGASQSALVLMAQ